MELIGEENDEEATELTEDYEQQLQQKDDEHLDELHREKKKGQKLGKQLMKAEENEIDLVMKMQGLSVDNDEEHQNLRKCADHAHFVLGNIGMWIERLNPDQASLKDDMVKLFEGFKEVVLLNPIQPDVLSDGLNLEQPDVLSDDSEDELNLEQAPLGSVEAQEFHGQAQYD